MTSLYEDTLYDETNPQMRYYRRLVEHPLMFSDTTLILFHTDQVSLNVKEHIHPVVKIHQF